MKIVSFVAFKKSLDASLSRIEREKKLERNRGEILESVIDAGAEFEEKLKNEKSPPA